MDLMICCQCGVQHDTRSIKSCKICDDPRQYVGPGGPSWTTLRSMQLSGKYTNTFTADPFHSGIIYITTTPSFAIGQRAILCCSPAGNVLWDCITYLDDSTISRINDLGGITAIAISHPHFYSTSLHWAAAFNCKVLLSAEDSQWLMRRGDAHELWEGKQRDLVGEFTVVKVGGHFPGSSVMLWKREKKLFVADSIMVVPSGVYQVDRPQGTTSFTFMWSYPNYIPLPPDDVFGIWEAVKNLDFEDTHGLSMGRDTRGGSKQRVLDSAKLFIKFMGHPDHKIMSEEV